MGWAGAIGHLGRELVHLGRDQIGRGARIPRRIGDVDAELLTELLGSCVTSVEQLGATAGTTDRVRLRLTGADVPSTVFVKMAPAAMGARMFGNVARLGANEVRFYRDVRPGLAIEAPTALGADLDERTGRFVLVLEDLAARGCTFIDTRTPLPLARAETAVEALAALHGRYWPAARSDGSAAVPIPRWVRTNRDDALLPLVASALPVVVRRLARIEHSLVPRDGRVLLRHYASVARTLDEGACTLIHGDPHPGNLYFAGDRVGLLDWQVLRRGNGVRDVAYLLVLGLDEATRVEHQRELLERYRHALADSGGPLLPADVAWDSYRSMAAYPYVAAAVTAGLRGLQDDDIALVGLRRAAVAIGDLATTQALGSSSAHRQGP